MKKLNLPKIGRRLDRMLNGTALEEALKRPLSLKVTTLPKTWGWGFALFIFRFGYPGIAEYISNGSRSEMIEALRETLRRLEQDQENQKDLEDD